MSWEDLFDRAAAHEVTEDEVRAAVEARRDPDDDEAGVDRA